MAVVVLEPEEGGDQGVVGLYVALQQGRVDDLQQLLPGFDGRHTLHHRLKVQLTKYKKLSKIQLV